MGLVLESLARVVFVLSAVAFLTFLLLWNAPGDPAMAIAQARYDAILSTQAIDEIRREVGLDGSFLSAFFDWLSPLLIGDFGTSFITKRPVLADVLTALSYTGPLALAGLAIGMAISLPLALLATRRPGSLLDRFTIALSSLGAAIPIYWLGLLLILFFAVQLGWLPAMGARTPAHAILPALALGLGVAASLTRIIRSGILEARGQDFLPAFHRRNVSESIIGRAHIAPHAAIPVVTVFGLELAFLLEGAVMLEVIFARPGLGSMLVSAINARDYPVVQAIVLLTAFLFVTVNLLIDLTYRFIDPRIGEADA